MKSEDRRMLCKGRVNAIGFAFTLAVAISAAPGRAQPPAQPVIAEQLREACRAVQGVDRRRLSESDAGSASYHADARAGMSAPPPGHAGPLIRLYVHYSSPPPAPSSSLLAWKLEDGRWFVSRLAYSPPPAPPGSDLPWPHDPGVAGDELPPSHWSVGQGTLAAADAERLESLLASRCFKREPVVRPRQLPLRRGPTLTCYWHPTSFHLEVSDRGRSRSLLRLCNLWQNAEGSPAAGPWPSDLVSHLLSSAALTPPPAAAAGPAIADVTEVPEGFRGQWAQRPEACAETDGAWFEVGAEGFAIRGERSPADRFERRGPRTLILHGPGPGMLQGAPMDRYSQPLLLSPDGGRLMVPNRMTGWDVLMHRCPAAATP